MGELVVQIESKEKKRDEELCVGESEMVSSQEMENKDIRGIEEKYKSEDKRRIKYRLKAKREED